MSFCLNISQRLITSEYNYVLINVNQQLVGFFTVTYADH